MYKNLGVSNTAIAFWTSILYIPWTIKPLWSPFVDILSTKRNWIIFMQIILAAAFFGMGMTIQLPWYFPISIVVLWIVAFSSATHDIAADGFYMLGLDQHQQAWFVGIRSTFYRFATITAMGLIVMFAGYIQMNTGLESVNFNVNAVPYEQITEVFNPNTICIERKKGKPRILHFPEEVTIPLYEKDFSEIDSINVFLALSASPEKGKTIVVNFGKKSGSKDISLTSSGRFEFNENNWDKPVKATFKIDPKLKEPAKANFRATAGNIPLSWAISFWILTVMYLLFSFYHKLILPHPADRKSKKTKEILSSYVDVFRTFFQKKGIVASILFLLFYRLAESQLVKLASPFMLDSRELGGLALSTAQVGIAYGTVGIAALLVGGLIGGFIAAKSGLKKWIWLMAVAINLPDIVYIYLSSTTPDSFLIVNICVAIEQFGYGIGFTGYMLFMIYLAEGEYKTSHFAITTAFMALGMMIPGMVSGKIQALIGYQNFFIWVIICTIPSFITLLFIKIDPDFGKKKERA
ncbi:MAG: MFS transporter [Candidatus Marinimicrobia bacterium]|nr:MFS transporter [Candidatus Neomarinimicrobiota bacterium]